MKTLIPVAVSDGSNSTYRARVIGKSFFNCSCTSGAEQAAKRLAEKWYGPAATVRPATRWDREKLLAGIEALGVKPGSRYERDIHTKMNWVIVK